MIRKTLIALCSLVSVSLFADPLLPNAELKIQSTEKLLSVEIRAKEGSHLNFDAPLKLELTGAKTKKPGPFGKMDFKMNSSSFVIELLEKAPSGAEMKLTYSICGNDNKSCRRVVEKRAL